MRALVLVVMTCAAAVVVAACGGGGDAQERAGPPRPFMMGLSTLPRELNADAYADAFELAGDNGEIVLIQRTPPWKDFLPGADISDDVAKTTAAEKKALQEQGLRLFFAIDPTDPANGRDRLADAPPALAGKDFDDDSVRKAFVAYARYVALNYKPTYLALGVEMNLYFEKRQDGLERFRSVYEEAYDAVKEASPDTQVSVTFQYEDLQGLMPGADVHQTGWPLLKAFEPRMDFVGISTYPSLAYPSVGAIPDNYYSQLQAFTDRPIVISQMGYSSDRGAHGLNSGTESEQQAFLERMLGEARKMQMPFVIWFAGWDPAYAKDSPYAVFEHIGLLRADGTEKPAWQTWQTYARRPYQPATVAASG